jgi:two-component system, chemotaxis family, chemotaxis protein CheY
VKKVLVVDDSQSIRSQVAAALEPADFEVLGAADGVNALQWLQDLADLDLLLLDVNLPGMSGLDLLERVMADPGTWQIPVLMLTSTADRELLERARKAGAKGWLVKPFKSELLLSTAKRLTLPTARQ